MLAKVYKLLLRILLGLSVTLELAFVHVVINNVIIMNLVLWHLLENC